MIRYAEQNIADSYTTRTTGTGLWIASLVFQIDAPITSETLSLSMSTPYDVLELGYGEIYVAPTEIGLSAPIALSGIPEPTTAALMAAGVLAAAWAGRRRA